MLKTDRGDFFFEAHSDDLFECPIAPISRSPLMRVDSIWSESSLQFFDLLLKKRVLYFLDYPVKREYDQGIVSSSKSDDPKGDVHNPGLRGHSLPD